MSPSALVNNKTCVAVDTRQLVVPPSVLTTRAAASTRQKLSPPSALQHVAADAAQQMTDSDPSRAEDASIFGLAAGLESSRGTSRAAASSSSDGDHMAPPVDPTARYEGESVASAFSADIPNPFQNTFIPRDFNGNPLASPCNSQQFGSVRSQSSNPQPPLHFVMSPSAVKDENVEVEDEEEEARRLAGLESATAAMEELLRQRMAAAALRRSQLQELAASLHKESNAAEERRRRHGAYVLHAAAMIEKQQQLAAQLAELQRAEQEENQLGSQYQRQIEEVKRRFTDPIRTPIPNLPPPAQQQVNTPNMMNPQGLQSSASGFVPPGMVNSLIKMFGEEKRQQQAQSPPTRTMSPTGWPPAPVKPTPPNANEPCQASHQQSPFTSFYAAPTPQSEGTFSQPPPMMFNAMALGQPTVGLIKEPPSSFGGAAAKATTTEPSDSDVRKDCKQLPQHFQKISLSGANPPRVLEEWIRANRLQLARISSATATAWDQIESNARDAYRRFVTEDIYSRDSVEASQVGIHCQFDASFIACLIPSIPTKIQSILLAEGPMTTARALFELMKEAGIGSTQEKSDLSTVIEKPRIAFQPSDIVSAINDWRIAVARAKEIKEALPSPTKLLLAVERFYKPACEAASIPEGVRMAIHTKVAALRLDLPTEAKCFEFQKFLHSLLGSTPDDAKPKTANPAVGQTSCFRCGKSGHDPDSCKHMTEQCLNCKNVGHVQAVCRQPGGGASFSQNIPTKKRASTPTPPKSPPAQVPNAVKGSRPCPFHRQGKCYFGDKCYMSHSGESGAEAAAAAAAAE